MGLLDRIGRVIRSQINSLVDESQDPEKILEQAVMKMEQELIEMRRALAEAIATHKSTERQKIGHATAAQKWYERAQVALEKGSEALAREALVHRQAYQTQAQTLQEQLDYQSGLIAKFKHDLRDLERKYAEAKARKNLYVARLRSAAAAQKIHELSGTLNNTYSSSVFDQMESKILELEAQSELMQGLKQDDLEDKFAALEGDKSVEIELGKLKEKKRLQEGDR